MSVMMLLLWRGHGVRREKCDGVPNTAALLIPYSKKGSLDKELLAPYDAIARKPSAHIVGCQTCVPPHGDGAVAVEVEDGPEYSPAFLILRPVLCRLEESVWLDEGLRVAVQHALFDGELEVFSRPRQRSNDGPGA